MHRSKQSVFILSSFLLAVALPDPASASSSYRYAHISHVEGELSLQRAAEPAPEPGTLNHPLFPGDRIWTQQRSFAEVRLAEGSVLRLSENTKVDFVELDSAILLRVWSGSVILKLEERRVDLRIDSPAGSVRPADEGLYRIDVHEGDAMTLTVARGTAELLSTSASVMVRSGEASAVRAGEPPDRARPFNTASYDEFDSWSERRDRLASTVREIHVVERLPREVRGYARDLSYHGDWLVDPVHGYVWYPQVSVGWAPYRDGRWCYTRFGYTWVSYEPWGWAPYHYGRWGHGHRGWYWIPGSLWGPAWVSFALGPFWVGWSPLGYHDRPVYVFHRGRHHRRHPYRGVYDDSPGWNFATRDEFGRRNAVRLDPSLVHASAGDARLVDGPAVLGRDFSPREVEVDRSGARRGGFAGLGRDEGRAAERATLYRSRTLATSSSPSRTVVERDRELPTPSRSVTNDSRVANDSQERGRRAFERPRSESGPGPSAFRRPGTEGASRDGFGRSAVRSGEDSRERGSGITPRSRVERSGRGESSNRGETRGFEPPTRERTRPASPGQSGAHVERGSAERRWRSGSAGTSSSPTRRYDRGTGRERAPSAASPRTPTSREGGAVRSRTSPPREPRGGQSFERGNRGDRGSSRPSPPSRGVERQSSSSGSSQGSAAGTSRGSSRSRPREN